MLEHYIAVGQQRMRCGYTTGTCAAGAARAAAEALLRGGFPTQIRVDTPAGIPVLLEPEAQQKGADWASCGVRKDAGDDCDVTDGALIVATVSRIPSGIEIDGGMGVGRVTRPGLNQPVGAAAINSGPRQMIAEQARQALREAGAGCGLRIVISAPEGGTLAAKTFNPRLGIEGGISILGSTGIVRPMSRQALVDTTRAELEVLRAEGVCDLLMTPGNYGADFAAHTLELDMNRAVQCSNFIGDALDNAVNLGFSSVLLVGHVGKLCKLAAGITDTHSRTADGRREVFVTHAALCGAETPLLRQLYDAATTDAALELLERAGLAGAVLDSIAHAVGETLQHRAGAMNAQAILFSQAAGRSAMTTGAAELLQKHRAESHSL